MDSIYKECNKYKREYDSCFIDFFQQFLSPDYKHKAATNPCQEKLQVYRACVDRYIEQEKPYDIDIDELRKEVDFKKDFNGNTK